MTISFKDYYLRNNNGLNTKDLEFLEWIGKIENKVYQSTGLKLLDIPDEAYRYHFENGLCWEKVSVCIIKDINENVSSLFE